MAGVWAGSRVWGSGDEGDDEVGMAANADGLNPDFLAIGLGGTSMMAMLWTVAMGRTAVGVEMRGDPFLGVHWNLRVDLYHQLGLIDDMMFDRWGEDGIPRRGDGRTFRLAECFYSQDTVAGDIVADEIIDSFDKDQHIVGTIHHVEFIDDRWRDGLPNRVVTLLQPPAPPARPDRTSIRTDIVDVLDGPSTFQAGAASVLVLLRRYLERIEALDVARGRPPRVRMFTRHRVITTEGDGFVDAGDGRLRVRIETLQEFDFKGKFVRIREPGSDVIDIGVPELFMVAEGFRSTDAQRLGFEQHDVEIDHHDGRGPVVAQADFLAGLIEALVGGRLRRRISSEFDDQGREYWVRQIAVGHEDDPEVGWVLIQVPDFKTFDPVEAGIVPAGTDPGSAEFYAGYQIMIYDYYLRHASEILEIPKDELRQIEMVYGPKLFSLVERVGDDPVIAANGVVAGDGFGNGHFLTSGGAITGMVGHGSRVLRYWEARDAGAEPVTAIRALADGIKEDTEAWLQVSAKEYSEAVPINFGGERSAQIAAASGIATHARAGAIDSSRRKRHSLLPLDPSDWRRLFLRNGAIRSAPLPALHAMHPALRSQRPAHPGTHFTVALVAPNLTSDALRLVRVALDQPGARVWLISEMAPYDLPEKVLNRIAGFLRVRDCFNGQLVEEAVKNLAEGGTPDVLLGTVDDLQVVLGGLRDSLGIAGLGAAAAADLSDRSRMLDRLRQAGLPVADDLDDWGEDAVTCWLDVMTVGRVPAWCSATRGTPRRSGAAGTTAGPGPGPAAGPGPTAGPGPAARPGPTAGPGPATITLPREVDDPADGAVRSMAVAALKALGTPSGLSHLTWLRHPDGRGALVDVSAHPPASEIMSLMSHAHGANMYRAWANAAIRGLFAPIPRVFAAGVAFFPPQGTGETIVAVHGWDEIRSRLGDIVVDARVPAVGQRSGPTAGCEPCVVVRHPETSVVDDALRRLVDAVRIEVG